MGVAVVLTAPPSRAMNRAIKRARAPAVTMMRCDFQHFRNLASFKSTQEFSAIIEVSRSAYLH